MAEARGNAGWVRQTRGPGPLSVCRHPGDEAKVGKVEERKGQLRNAGQVLSGWAGSGTGSRVKGKQMKKLSRQGGIVGKRLERELAPACLRPLY